MVGVRVWPAEGRGEGGPHRGGRAQRAAPYDEEDGEL